MIDLTSIATNCIANTKIIAEGTNKNNSFTANDIQDGSLEHALIQAQLINMLFTQFEHSKSQPQTSIWGNFPAL